MNTTKLVIGGIVALVLFLLIMAINPFVVIQAGHRGVVLQLGSVSRIANEGLSFRTPLIESVKDIDIRTQKHETKAEAASKDLQTVNAVVVLNYSLDPTKVGDIYKTVGEDFEKRIMDPVLQESIKATTAQFTAEELITKRTEVKDKMEFLVAERLHPRGIIVEGLNIINFDFSASFNAAIEAKVTAEQNALAAKNRLEQVKYEAEQRIAQAKGEAEAIRIQSEAIQANGGENYVQLQAIKQWRGEVPQYMMGSTIPFINLGK